MRLLTIHVPWHRFTAVLLLVIGVWLECLAYLAPTAAVLFAVLGLVLVGLSYFISRRKNWARVTIAICLFAVCFADVILLLLLLFQVITEELRSDREIEIAVVLAGFLILLASLALFLINKPVVDEFRRPDTDSQIGDV